MGQDCGLLRAQIRGNGGLARSREHPWAPGPYGCFEPAGSRVKAEAGVAQCSGTGTKTPHLPEGFAQELVLLLPSLLGCLPQVPQATRFPPQPALCPPGSFETQGSERSRCWPKVTQEGRGSNLGLDDSRTFSHCLQPLLHQCLLGLAPCPPWAVTAPKGSVLFKGGGPGRGCGSLAAAGQDSDLAGGEVSILASGAGPGPKGPGLYLRTPRDQPYGGGPVPSVPSLPAVVPSWSVGHLHTLSIASSPNVLTTRFVLRPAQALGDEWCHFPRGSPKLGFRLLLWQSHPHPELNGAERGREAAVRRLGQSWMRRQSRGQSR